MKYTFLLFIALTATGCGFNRIGSLTMASSRNVERSADYVLLKRDVEGVSRLKQDEALNEAMDDAVSKVPGGEYMMNMVIKVSGRKVKVVGDVYGLPGGTRKQHRLDQVYSYLPGDEIVVLDDRGRTVRGKFIKIENDLVHLTMSNGKVLTVPVGRVKT